MFDHLIRECLSAVLLPLFLVTLLGAIAGASPGNPLEAFGGVVKFAVSLVFGSTLRLLEICLKYLPHLIGATRTVFFAVSKVAIVLVSLVIDWSVRQFRKEV